MKNILIIGSGAREHAIAKALHRSPKKPAIFCCGPSYNPGIKKLTTDYWLGKSCDVLSIVKQALTWNIDFVIIGPEAPLEKGLADSLWDVNIPVVGPKKKLAKIETSKAFTRELFKKYNIPGSPAYRVFHDMDGVRAFLEKLGEHHFVIKANGLMGGKGVKVAGDHLHSFNEAYLFCEELLSLGQSFVIEEKKIGQEFSLLYFCDGHSLIAMPLVQDHKRAFLHDEGPNTGGMGSYSDANHRLPFLTEDDLREAHHINEAMLSALTAEYREKYIGFLYSSFMVTKKGVCLIEYNARLGDPEAMNVLALLESDLVDVCEAMLSGTLSSTSIRFAQDATVCKYVVPVGYPDHPTKDTVIDVSSCDQDLLYYAAVEERDGVFYTLGSRAVAVVGVGRTISEAEQKVEKEIAHIHGDVFHRPDIGTDELIERRIQMMQEIRS